MDNDILRFEVRNLKKQASTFFSLDPITYINDYSVGLQYAINNKVGNCSLRAVKGDAFKQNPSFDEEFNTLLDFMFHIQNVNFLESGDQYIYAGRKTSNGISSDRFISKKTTGVYEYTFSTV